MEEKREVTVNESVYKRFFDIVGSPEEGKRISQAKAAQALGYSAGTVSAYKARNYNGNIPALETKIAEWVAREERRLVSLSVPIADTASAEQIDRVLTIAHEERVIGVIVGEPGVGKTTGARRYMSRNPSALFIEVDQNFTKRTLTLAVAEAVGVEKRGGTADVCARIIETLRERDAVLIFDEAEAMPDVCLELIRRVINDKAQTGVVFIGLPDLEYKIRNLQNNHQQLMSRVGAFLKLGKLDKSDAVKVLSGVWQDLSADALDAFLKSANGSVRVLVILMGRVYQVMGLNRLDSPTAEAVAVAGKSLMR